MCHLVLFMPVLALPLLWLLPLPLAIPIYALVVLLSAWLYYVVYRLMRRTPVIGPETLLEARGRVISAEGRCGLVRIRNELWRAEAAGMLHENEPVRVIGRRGLVLQVMRDGAGAERSPRGDGRARSA